MPRFPPDIRRWIRHNRNLSGFVRLWDLGNSDPSSPRLVSPWIGDIVQPVVQISPFLLSEGITQPAAGAEWTRVVPHDVNWRLLSITWRFVTDANVANRLPRLQLTDAGGRLLWFSNSNTFQAASQDITYSCSAIALNPGTDSPNLLIPIPARLWLPRFFAIGTFTPGIQVGDQFSVIGILAEEWPG